MTNILTSDHRLVGMWRAPNANGDQGNLFSVDDVAEYLAQQTFMGRGVFNVMDPSYGAKGDGTTDDTAAIQAAVNAGIAAVGSGFIVYFPRPSSSYRVNSTLQINAKAVWFKGCGFNQVGIHYYGTGPCIQLGTDDGNSWDAAEYNGVAQGFRISDLSLACIATTTPLLNTITGASYGSGTYGVRDWRGGSVRIERCSISHFEYGFWGLQSDINYFEDIIPNQNHVAFWLGPRSDQARFNHIWSSGNDTTYIFEGSKQHLVEHWISDTDGSSTTNVAILRNSTPSLNAKYATTRITAGILFSQPWLEQQGSFGNVGNSVEAIFDLNIGDATQGGAVIIDRPFAITNLYSQAATLPVFLHLVKADNCTSVTIDGLTGVPGGTPWNNMRSVIKAVAGAGNPPAFYFYDADRAYSSRLAENYASATLNIAGPALAAQGQRYTYNVVGGTGGVTQGFHSFQRVLQHNNAPPGSGTWDGGDVILNRVWAAGKPARWMMAGGSPGTVYAEVIPSVSADRGNGDLTLTANTDENEVLFATDLTALRTTTLSATGALPGNVFMITREDNGAFNMNIVDGATSSTLKAMPARSWCICAWDGHTNKWRLRRYGTL